MLPFAGGLIGLTGVGDGGSGHYPTRQWVENEVKPRVDKQRVIGIQERETSTKGRIERVDVPAAHSPRSFRARNREYHGLVHAGIFSVLVDKATGSREVHLHQSVASSLVSSIGCTVTAGVAYGAVSCAV